MKELTFDTGMQDLQLATLHLAKAIAAVQKAVEMLDRQLNATGAGPATFTGETPAQLALSDARNQVSKAVSIISGDENVR